MSTLDRAAYVIAEANAARRSRRGNAVDIVTMQAAREYAQALADAGLLTPNNPQLTPDRKT